MSVILSDVQYMNSCVNTCEIQAIYFVQNINSDCPIKLLYVSYNCILIYLPGLPIPKY